MGDMAYMALEETMEAETDRFLYRIGQMSYGEAYERGVIDESGCEPLPPWFQKRLEEARKYRAEGKTCRYCNRKGLLWKNTDNGWRLAEPSGAIHSCNNRVKW